MVPPQVAYRRHPVVGPTKSVPYLYRTIGEFIPFGVWHVDLDGRMRHMSPSSLDMTGMTIEQVATGGWIERMPAEDRDRFQRAWQARRSG